MTYLPELAAGVQADLNDVLVGEKLGEGQFRKVFALKFTDKYVIKIETNADKNFSNVHEWEAWIRAERDYPEVAVWLAPCVYISDYGAVLAMARTKPIKKLPEFMPDFFTDVKLANFGLYKNRIVCHDYGWNLCIENSFKKFKMVKPKLVSE